MGDDRIKKNLDEGASQCRYAVVVLSKDTKQSACAMEEISILHQRYVEHDVTLFPVLYELPPEEIPLELQWIKELIYKEVARHTGTLEICNHIACKLTGDILQNCHYQSITDIIGYGGSLLTPSICALFKGYQKVACENLNSRVSLLYAIFLEIIYSKSIPITPVTIMITKIFERVFSETRLDLPVDYRELWLLENAICILIDYCSVVGTEPKM